jgi:hypothetical protein
VNFSTSGSLLLEVPLQQKGYAQACKAAKPASSPPKELPTIPRAARVVPLLAASAISKPQPPKKSFTPHHHHHHHFPPIRAIVLAEQDKLEMAIIESKPFANPLALAKQ